MSFINSSTSSSKYKHVPIWNSKNLAIDFFESILYDFNFQKFEWKPLENKFLYVLINSCYLKLSDD